jgi:hypothetical protein
MVETLTPEDDAKPRFPRLEGAGPWTEIAGAVVMSIAALVTSWASYQASLWDGDQAAAYSKAEGFRTEASRRSTRAGQLLAADVLLFTNWLDARAHGDEQLQAFYTNNFRPGFKAAQAEWLAMRPLENPSAPRTPFSLPSYQIPEATQAKLMTEHANRVFLTGQRANEISDGYVKVTVFLAAALFFGGIGQAFRILPVRLTLIAVALANLVWGIVVMLGLPVN